MWRKVAMTLALLVAGGAGVAEGCNPPDDPNPVGASGEWDLNWRDEFTGTSLDSTKWNDGWFNTVNGSTYTHPVNSLEDGCFDQNLSNVSDGFLHLGSGTNSDPDCERRDGTTAPYRGSSIDTRDKFETTYGFFEARINMPGVNGDCYNWPAFWTDGAALNWPTSGEIDVVECLSDHKGHWHYHYSGGGPGGGDYTTPGWHTYGVAWEPGKLTFYFDGSVTGTWTTGVISEDHFVIVGNQMRTSYGPHPGAVVDVDYVRVWKKAAT